MSKNNNWENMFEKMKKFGEFNFGRIDGKTETEEYKEKNIKIEDMFYNHEDIYKKLDNKRYIILGDKGTGKTLLIEYFKEKKRNLDSNFIEMNIVDIVNKYKIKNKEYNNFSFFIKYHIFSKLASYLITLQPLGKISEKERKILNQIVQKEPMNLDITKLNILEFNSDLILKIPYIGKILFHIKNSIFKKSQKEDEYQKVQDSILSFLDTVLMPIKKKQIYIIFDELDNMLKDNYKKDYKFILEELITSVEFLNNYWRKKQIDSRIILSIRMDMFQTLNLTNLNKLKEDYSVVLDWGIDDSKTSPLFKLIFNKMKNQDDSIKRMPDEIIFREIFDSVIEVSENKTLEVDKYILGKTFLRPRDIIAFFIKLSYKCKEKSKISLPELQDVAKEFSTYIYSEARDRIVGYIEPSEYECFLELIKAYNKTIFSYKGLEEFFQVNIIQFGGLTTKNFWEYFKCFFEIGLIGEVKYVKKNTSFISLFKYRNKHIIPSKEGKFTLHFGIRDYLGMSREKKSKQMYISDEIYTKIKILLGYFAEKEFSVKELINFISDSDNVFLKEIKNEEVEEGINYFYVNDFIKEIIIKPNGKRKEEKKKKEKIDLNDTLVLNKSIIEKS